MTETGTRVRFNYAALIVAALVNFVFEAVWFSVFMNQWLAGIGHDRKWLMNSGVGPNFQYLQYLLALLCAFVMAMGMSWVMQKTGEQSAVRGLQVALLVWFLFVLTDHVVGDIFALVPLSAFLVNAGYMLVGMCIMGVIVGAWKAKAQ